MPRLRPRGRDPVPPATAFCAFVSPADHQQSRRRRSRYTRLFTRAAFRAHAFNLAHHPSHKPWPHRSRSSQARQAGLKPASSADAASICLHPLRKAAKRSSSTCTGTPDFTIFPPGLCLGISPVHGPSKFLSLFPATGLTFEWPRIPGPPVIRGGGGHARRRSPWL